MKILYIGVHSHKGWGAEYWLKRSFQDLNIKLELIDYRLIRKEFGLEYLKLQIESKSIDCDIIFLQRGDRLSPNLFGNIHIPLIFWSTEPIQLKNDADDLLRSKIFSWIFVHSYSCLDRIASDFTHINNISSVMHNAAPREIIKIGSNKKRFAIFNRNLSWRRKWWLFPSRKLYDKINGRFGDDYFKDLRESIISINIHYSNKNLDDFESGIFESMASGCAIISERLHSQTLKDLGLEDAIIQVDKPRELKEDVNAKDLLEAGGKYLKYSDLLLQKGRMLAKNKNTAMIDREIDKEKKKLGIKEEVASKFQEMAIVMEAEGDKEKYQKIFRDALKKFGVDSPADFKSDEEKKKFFNYVDKNYKGDHEESVDLEKELNDNVDETLDKIREANISKQKSMRSILADIWNVNEGKNPFEKEKKEEKSSKKTLTGKKPTAVDIEPEVE